MPADIAFDSNVVLYLLSAEEAKAETAARLLSQKGVVSVQVLNEVSNVMRRKWQMACEEIDDFLQALMPVCIIRPLTLSVHRLGLDLARRHHFSIYDAMIVAAAIDSGCRVLYSEDMPHGFTVGRLHIINPFHAQGDIEKWKSFSSS